MDKPTLDSLRILEVSPADKYRVLEFGKWIKASPDIDWKEPVQFLMFKAFCAGVDYGIDLAY